MRITDYKTGSADRAPKANESLQLGIYYLAVLESEELKEFQPVSGVELSYLKGDWRDGALVTREWTVGTADREEAYQNVMREKLSSLVGELKRLNDTGVYRPDHQADCFFCEFQSLCPLVPRGTAAVRRRTAGVASGSDDVSATATFPQEILDVLGGRAPTAEQWRAITWPLEPYVLVAGAGSGKTSVMAARVVYLALVALGRHPGEEGVLPGNVLCLTFTNKATENLQHRVRRALAGLDLPDGEEPEITNYHGFAAELLERHGVLIGVEPGQRVLTAAQRVELCARVLDRMTFDVVPAQRLPGVVDRILTLDDQAANHFRTPEEIVEFDERRLEELKDHRSDRAYSSARERIELAKACAVFRDLKRELDVIDFGDQIELALDIVQQHPGSRASVPRSLRDRAARRVPGHQRGAGAPDGRRVRRRPPRDGRRRSRPEHLRLARRHRCSTCSSSPTSSGRPTAGRRPSSPCTPTSDPAHGSWRPPTC